MKQLLRTINRWQFETPLALGLAAAAGFAGLAMPHETLGHVPVASGLGNAGRLLLALLAAALFGAIGYVAMRSAGKPRVAAAPVEVEPEVEEDESEPVAPDRLRRLRRADAHPDAPPRAPIRASRDLGEPFMEAPVETGFRPGIPDGEYVEVDEFTAIAPASEWDEPEASVAPEPTPVPVEWSAEPAPAELAPVAMADASIAAAAPEAFETSEPVARAAAEAPARPMRESLAAMMERLSSGLERRSSESTQGADGVLPAAGRDMSPALRDALDELNRLASRRN